MNEKDETVWHLGLFTYNSILHYRVLDHFWSVSPNVTELYVQNQSIIRKPRPDFTNFATKIFHFLIGELQERRGYRGHTL